MKNTMSDLRNHLFETLEGLKDKEQPLELERAKAVCEVAQTIINSAKVEVDAAKAIGASELTSELFMVRVRDDGRKQLPKAVPRAVGGGV